ncbi:MAG: DUF1127 domain-containing protein [Paracoccaceae bacterium]|nr:DUF1127 domain-containing protein [Paracoccaceae bacterium]
MALSLNTNPIQNREPVLASLTFKESSLFDAFITWNTARKTRNVLLILKDRELTDIGLTRGDIMRMARW